MALSLDSLGGWVQKGFAKAAVTTAAGLKDDELVRSAARNIYDVIPFPANVAIKMSVGVEGLERFALVLRDKLLAAGITDVSQIGADQLRRIMVGSLSSVPGLGRVFGAANGADPVEPVASKVDASDDSAAMAGSPPPAAKPQPALPPKPKSWYVLRGETRYGPWTDTEFLSIAEDGRLDVADRVWRDGFPDWIVLSDLPAAAQPRV